MKQKINQPHFWTRLGSITLISFFLMMPSMAEMDPQHQGQVPPAYPGQSQANHDEDVWEAQQQKRMAKKYNLERQQDIRKDTEKLLELATELKQAVDKSNENTLSLDVIRKAEQIEKLAKTVKDKMKG